METLCSSIASRNDQDQHLASLQDRGEPLALLNAGLSVFLWCMVLVLGGVGDIPALAQTQPVSGSLTISPNPVTVQPGQTGGTAVVSWTATGSDLYELYRYNPDGTSSVAAADSSGSLQFSGLVSGTQFKLVTSPFGQLVASATVTVAPAYQLSAYPNPIGVPIGQAGATTLTWTATGRNQLEIRVGDPKNGGLLATGGSAGSATTDSWVTDGMMFFLVDANTHEVLASTQVSLAFYSLWASPSVISVAPGETMGSTTINWSAPGHPVEIHIGSTSGPVFAAGNDTGSAPTGNWVTDKMQFFAVDPNSQQVLASTTVSVTSQPLPPPWQTETRPSKDYIYLGGQLVAIENPLSTGPSDGGSGPAASAIDLQAGFLAPRLGDIVTGQYQVMGWAVDMSDQPTAISKVEITIDGVPAGTATYGIDSYDVCRVLGGRPECPQIGWSFTLDTTALADGLHELSFLASNSSNPALSRSSTLSFVARNHVDSVSTKLTAISSIANTDGRIDLFAFSPDGALWRNTQLTGADQGWTGWNSLAGGYYLNSPTAAKNQDGRVQVFSRGPSNFVYEGAQAQSGSSLWGDLPLLRWLPEPNLCFTSPAIVMNSSGQLEIFTRSVNNTVWNARQNTPGSSEWSDWTYLQGSTSDLALSSPEPVAVSNQDGRLAVFIQSVNNELLFNLQASGGGWPSRWTDMNTTTEFRPAVVKNATGQLAVVAVSADQQIRYSVQQMPNANAWSAWTPIPVASIVSNPVLILDQTGRLQLFAQTSGNTLKRTIQAPDGSWSAWQNVATNDASSPSIVLNASGHLEAFFLATDSTAYRIVEDGSGATGWSAPSALNTFITPAIPEDQFNDSAVNTNLWTKQDATGNAQITEATGHVQFSLPAGSTHDAAPTGNTSVALLQSVNNTNFSVEAKFDSAATGAQGLMAAQDNLSYIRCDVIPYGSGVHAYSAFLENTTVWYESNVAIATSQSYWLRLSRNGNTWACSVSGNGTDYQVVNQFIHTLNLQRLGPWAGNQGNERTALVDYFVNGPAVSSQGGGTSPVSVSVSPVSSIVAVNQTQQLTATVRGTTNQLVTWSVLPAEGAGTISTTGLYAAPTSIAAQQTVMVRATSVADSTKSATATVIISPLAGSTNVAQGILPTGRNGSITDGSLATDGVVDSSHFADQGSGVQWIQLDLGRIYTINGVKLWHYFADSRTYHGVVVQLSRTADFTSGTVTVFNNDQTNQDGQGIGTDAEYIETSDGKMISFSPVNARYVRVWSNGSTANEFNHTVEVAVYGTANLAVGIVPTGREGYVQDGALATDGIVDSSQFADQGSGVQWLQLDLGQVYPVNGVKLWHYFADSRTYHGVIVQLSTTADFTSGTVTVFNNDQTNQNGQGTGADAEYVETSDGKMISFSTLNARYVRFWSNGSTANAFNHTVEVAVYAATIGVSVTVTPTTATLGASQTRQFSAVVNGVTDQQVTWSVLPAEGVGTISATGVYTAPASIAAQQTVTVRATSVADTTKVGTATVTLDPSAGSTNFALGIVPTGTDGYVPDGALATDGIVDSNQFADQGSGLQWLQLDLGQIHAISGVKLWHYFADGRTYHGVVVQLSTTPDFTSGTTTVFNNDQANQDGQGIGTDAEYIETSEGKTIWFSSVNARYVRFWSNGSNANQFNHTVEAAVYGTP